MAKKGETAMDVRKKICDSIMKALSKHNKINIEVTRADLIIQTGYSEKFVNDCIRFLAESKRIKIEGEYAKLA